MRARKKPVVVEVTQWFKNGDHPEDNCRMIDMENGIDKPFKSEGKIVRYFRRPDIRGETICCYCGRFMEIHGWIDTLEGGHTVCPSDWIITGVKGEKYPCKDNIFQATYDLLDKR